MKKSLLLLCLFLPLVVFSQNSASFAPSKRLGVSLQLNSPNPDDIGVGWFDIDTESVDNHNLRHKSFSLGAVLQYRVREETALRVRVARTGIWVKEYQPSLETGGYLASNTVYGRQVKWQVAPGIAWEFSPTERLRCYVGFELPFNFHGKYKFDQTQLSVTPTAGDTLSYESSKYTIPKGHSLGVAAIAGFNYFLGEGFSLGAEFSPALLYADLAGEATVENRRYVASGYYLSYSDTTTDANKGYTFYEQRFSMNLTYWLQLGK